MMSYLQKMGRSLMLPVAILPVASILMAVGLAKDKNGAAGLSGLVAFLIITTILSKDVVAQLQGVKPEEVALAFSKSTNAFIGILSGIIGGEMYNRFKDV